MYIPGSNVSLSVVGIPAAMQAPAPLAVKQWYTIFTRGGAIARPLAAISALATGYLAYHRTFRPISISLPTPMPPLQSQATH